VSFNPSYQLLEVWGTSKLIDSLQSFSRKASLIVLSIGAFVLLGWKLNLEALINFWSAEDMMPASTAFCLILGSVFSLTWHRQLAPPIVTQLSRVCAVIVLAISLLAFIQNIFGWQFDLVQLLFANNANFASSSMSLNAAINFLLLSSAWWLLSRRSPQYVLAQILTFMALLLAGLGLLGHAYGFPIQYGLDAFVKLEWHSASALVLLSLSTLFARPHQGLTAIVIREDSGGGMVRRLTPVAVIASLALSGFIIAGYQIHLYSAEVGMAFLGILSLTSFLFFLHWSAQKLSFIESRWQQSQTDLQQTQQALQIQVEKRTNELGDIILRLYDEIATREQAQEALRQSELRERQRVEDLQQTLKELKRTQSQLIQSEKMSSLGQLVAGVAHEINNPVNFIYGNLTHAKEYSHNLLTLLQDYQEQFPPNAAIEEEMEAIEFEFIQEDLPKLLSSMQVGAERIREIVLSLRTFSRLDESQMKAVDIHEGIESTLMILHNRLKAKSDYPAIEVIKDFADLPLIECYAGQLNQVFMNLLNNAIDALEERRHHFSNQAFENPYIRMSTQLSTQKQVMIKIADNGIGMSEATRQRLFDPFFTTKPVGKGTGLGLSISYQIIVENHQGQLTCHSTPGKGTEFMIEIPCKQS
jgi:signal transduction histidine kinase